jgi:hypothetical protein
MEHSSNGVFSLPDGLFRVACKNAVGVDVAFQFDLYEATQEQDRIVAEQDAARKLAEAWQAEEHVPGDTQPLPRPRFWYLDQWREWLATKGAPAALGLSALDSLWTEVQAQFLAKKKQQAAQLGALLNLPTSTESTQAA